MRTEKGGRKETIKQQQKKWDVEDDLLSTWEEHDKNGRQGSADLITAAAVGTALRCSPLADLEDDVPFRQDLQSKRFLP